MYSTEYVTVAKTENIKVLVSGGKKEKNENDRSTDKGIKGNLFRILENKKR
jgi:hypothetical protein